MNILRRFAWHVVYSRRTYSRWAAILVLFLIYHLSSSYWNLPADLIRYYEIQQQILDKNGADTSKCNVPKLDPHDPSIRKYISKPNPLLCKQIQWELAFLDDAGVLRRNDTAFKLSGYSDVQCSARCFDHNTGVDDDSVRYGEWIQYDNELSMGCQFVEVTCTRGVLGLAVFSFHFMNISKPPKPLFSNGQPKIDSLISSESLNVALFVVDSMSRSNVIRQMPLTYSYIQNNMSGIVFDGHSKIGDNTWVNMLAMVTGLRSVPTAEFPADLSQVEEQFFDDYAPYLWRNFSRAGYYTLYSEDRPDIQSFNYGVRKGFLHRPTDYYDRPYWQASWNSFLRKRSTGFCYNTIPEHKIQLDYLRRFLRVHRDEKAFGILWWQALTHDFLNTIGLADFDTMQFLQSIRPYLNRTILLILSDHGHRYDSIRQSIIGRLETRLPFMAAVVPDWFKNRYPNAIKNLATNAKEKLTTQFDVYATLVDILENNLDSTDASQPPSSVPSYAISLFRPIPSSRTCHQARIPEEYCPCYTDVGLPQDEPMVQRAATVMLRRVNSLLSENRPPCALLKLNEIVQSAVFLPHRAMIRDPQVGNKVPSAGFYVNYRLVIRTRPGDALLEGVVKHFMDDGGMTMDSDIERNNAYGNTSYCVKNIVLKKYCYCSQQ